MINIYLLFFITIFALAYPTFKDNKKYNTFYLITIFTLAILISSLRSVNVGIDSNAYYNIYMDAFNYSPGMKYNEPVFVALVLALRKLNNIQSFFIFCSVFSFSSIAFFTYKYSKQNFLTISLLFLLWALDLQMCITRQYLAIALYLLLFYSLEKKQYLSSILLSVLVSGVHNTSIVLIPIMILPFIFNIDRKFIRYLFFAIPISLFTFRPLITVFLKILPKYSHYLNGQFMETAFMANWALYIVCGLCIACCYTYLHYLKNPNRKAWYKNVFKESDVDTSLLMKFIYLSTWILVFETISLQGFLICRISYYFIPFLTILFSYLYKILQKKALIIILSLIFIVCILSYIPWAQNDVFGVRPFSFFF